MHADADDSAPSTAQAGSAAAPADASRNSGSAEDGAVYLASVEAAQHELDAAGTTSSAVSSAPTWPGPDSGYNQLARMKAATKAALAAVGLHDDHKVQASSAADVEAGAAAAPAPAAEALQVTYQLQSESSGPQQTPAGVDPGSFDLGLVNSWSSTGADAVSDSDGAEATGAVGTAPTEANAESPGRSGSSSSNSVADAVNKVLGAKAGLDKAASSDVACIENVVLSLACGAAAEEKPAELAAAADLYALD